MSKNNIYRIIESTIMFVLLFIFIGLLSKPSETYAEDISVEPVIVEEKEELEEYEVPDESEKIEQALVEQNYIRDDIPLDADTQSVLQAACEEFDIPYELALAVIWQETNYSNVTGDNGNAEGYMQIWEYWNHDRMERIGAYDLMNPVDNFRTGCCILHDAYNRTGSYYDALSVYNTGSSGWSWYADEVMAKWESLDI